MRHFGIAIAAMLLMTAASQATPLYPNGAQALEAQLLAKMGPATRGWIVTEAQREVSMGYYSIDTQTQAAMRFGTPAGDLSALSFLVLMQAARDADAAVHNAVDNRNMAATQVAREEQLQNGLNKYATHSELSPSSDIAVQQGTAPTLLSSKFKTQDPSTANTTHPDDSQQSTYSAPKSVDMQTVMDKESDIEDTLAQAAKLMTPSAVAAVQPMG
jgi:hypothetical protein